MRQLYSICLQIKIFILGSHSEEEKNYSYRNLMLMALGFGTVCSVAFHILTNEPENQKLEVRARYIRLINLIICRYNKTLHIFVYRK